MAHELAEAQAFADRLAVLDHGQILKVGTPWEIAQRPATRRVAELVGYGGFAPAGPGAAAKTMAQAAAGGAPTPDDGPTAGVHPDRVMLGAHPDLGIPLAGTIIASRPA